MNLETQTAAIILPSGISTHGAFFNSLEIFIVVCTQALVLIYLIKEILSNQLGEMQMQMQN